MCFFLTDKLDIVQLSIEEYLLESYISDYRKAKDEFIR